MQRNAIKQRCHANKAQVWISAVLYIMIAVAVMVLVLEAGIPVIKGMKEKSSFTKAKDTMLSLDQQIRDVASEGQGSQRVVPLEINDGKITVEGNKLRWKMETETKLLEPRTKISQGSLVITADVDVSAAEIADYYILQNSKVLVNFSKFGSETNITSINTSRLINYVEFKENNARTNGTFTFNVNNSAATSTGKGYTKLLSRGSGLVGAAVLAHVNTTNFDYDIEFTLESKSDFLKTELKNVVVK